MVKRQAIGVKRFGKDSTAITVIGEGCQSGTYVLRMQLRSEITMACGQFKKGKLITFPPGDYAYVGSALATQGATCLARRLLRHATRTGGKPAHGVRDLMLRAFNRVGLAPSLAPTSKQLRWNVDHILDRSECELVEAIAVRSPIRIEAQIGRLIESDPVSTVVEKGLGANDIAGNTHLLLVNASELWWRDLASCLVATKISNTGGDAAA
jgi:Uri superfamily endonuclease